MTSISEEIREIEQEIASLYRRKRILEMEQQRQWSEMYGSAMTAINEPINYGYLFDGVYGNNS